MASERAILQNTGQPAPSFDNTGFAIAEEAFGGVSKGARLLAEGFYKRQTEQDAQTRVIATNDLLKKGLADGAFTPEDILTAAPNVVDIDFLTTALSNFEKSKQDVATSKSSSLASDAAAAWNNAQIAEAPERLIMDQNESESRIGLQNAQASAAGANERESNANRELANLQRSNIQEDREKANLLIRNRDSLGNYLNGTHAAEIDPATGKILNPGSFDWEYSQKFDEMFPQIIKQYEKPGNIPPTPEEITGIKKQWIAAQKEEIVGNPEKLIQLGLNHGLAAEDTLRYTREGQAIERMTTKTEDQTVLDESALNKQQEKTLEAVNKVSNNNRNYVIYNGRAAGHEFRKSENTLSFTEAKDLVGLMGLDSSNSAVEKVLSLYSDSTSFKNVITEIADHGTTLWGNSKLTFPNKDVVTQRLNVIKDGESAKIQELTKVPETITGTSEDQLRIAIAAAYSKEENPTDTTPKDKVGRKKENEAKSQIVLDKILKLKEDFNQISPGNLNYADAEIYKNLNRILSKGTIFKRQLSKHVSTTRGAFLPWVYSEVPATREEFISAQETGAIFIERVLKAQEDKEISSMGDDFLQKAFNSKSEN